jgi:hypothetical protein
MPNALILGYQKSRIRHTPSHLYKWSRSTRSFVKVVVFNTRSFIKDCVFNTGGLATQPSGANRSPTKPAKR